MTNEANPHHARMIRRVAVVSSRALFCGGVICLLIACFFLWSRYSLISYSEPLMDIHITVISNGKPMSGVSVTCYRRPDARSLSSVSEQLITDEAGVATTQAIVRVERKLSLLGRVIRYDLHAIDVFVNVDGQKDPIQLLLAPALVRGTVYAVEATIPAARTNEHR